MTDSFHESFGQREKQVGGPSNRSFGLTVGGIFAAICLVKLWASGDLSVVWRVVLGAGLLLITLAIIAPGRLTLLNRYWMKLGVVLATIVNPVVLFLMFVLFFVPLALLFRVIGRDALRIRKQSQPTSFWITRDPPGPAPDSATNQF